MLLRLIVAPCALVAASGFAVGWGEQPDKPTLPPQSEPAAPAKPEEPKADPSPPKAPESPSKDDPSAEDAEPDTAEEKEAVVWLRDGRRIAGFLVSQGTEETVIRIEGINTPIPGDVIDRVEVLPSAAERYKELRAAISDEDADRLLLLVEWLFARKQYELAQKEVETILKHHPGNAPAKKLKVLVEQQRELIRAAKERAKPSDGGSPPPSVPRSRFPLLSADQLNLLRVYQVDLDKPPRMLVPREFVDAIIKNYADRPEVPATEEGRQGLYRRRPAQLLRLAFELKARELYGMVKVLDEPEPLRLFRENVWRGWFVNACATTKCHGGEEAGRLWVLNRKTNADTTIYTNFMILHQYTLEDGTPLINYQNPADSPLLQMAMKPEASKRPHPRVQSVNRGETYRWIFDAADDRRFQETVAWIKAMYVPEGRNYPISYTPPIPAGLAGDPAFTPDGKRKPDPGR